MLLKVNRKTFWNRIGVLIFIFLGSVAVWFIQFNIDIVKQRKLLGKPVEELMYFPSGKFVKPALIEYQSGMSDLIWLRAVQYSGQHLTDNKFVWLAHIFDILTTLDTKFIGAYDFGSKTLAWNAKQVSEAESLLSRGIINNPLEWKLAFGYAFIEYVLTKNYVDAGYYFEIASKLPYTWKITERWAAFSFAKGGAKELAIELWDSIYYTTENSRVKELAEWNLAELGIKLNN